jgi:hypothetical protein
MLPCPKGVPGWTGAWRAVVGGSLGRQWEVGLADADGIARAVAQRLDIGADVARSHMDARCRELAFFPSAWTAACTRSLPQALVTVNPDVFAIIVQHYELELVFDTIVTSWEEGTADKTELCDVARARLGRHHRQHSLLIDNTAANCDAWRAQGGHAYWFVSDHQFAADHARGWDALCG